MLARIVCSRAIGKRIRSDGSSGGTVALTRKSTLGRLSNTMVTISKKSPEAPQSRQGLPSASPRAMLNDRRPRFGPPARHQRTAPICGITSYQGTMNRMLSVRKY